MYKGYESWDKAPAFEDRAEPEERADTPNETLEKPVIIDLVGKVDGPSIPSSHLLTRAGISPVNAMIGS
jgi:hypothetical protein